MSVILLESGDRLLLESGSALLSEDGDLAVTPAAGIVTQGYGAGFGISLLVGQGYRSGVVVVVLHKSDRAALDAIAALLRATGKFHVEVGKDVDATKVAAKYGAVAHLALDEDARSKPDQSPLMTLNGASYTLSILVRGPRTDRALSDRADRLKRIAVNAIMADGSKAYGGFCLPWHSRLDAQARVRPTEVGIRVEMRGSFAYYVDQSAGGYSEAV